MCFRPKLERMVGPHTVSANGQPAETCEEGSFVEAVVFVFKSGQNGPLADYLGNG
jgi:hypothetical protein